MKIQFHVLKFIETQIRAPIASGGATLSHKAETPSAAMTNDCARSGPDGRAAKRPFVKTLAHPATASTRIIHPPIAHYASPEQPPGNTGIAEALPRFARHAHHRTGPP